MVKVERKYLAGEFHCKYNGELLKDYDSSGEALYSLEPYEYQILNALPSSAVKPKISGLATTQQFHSLAGVPIRLRNQHEFDFYKETVVDVLLYDIELLKVNKEDRQTYGTLKAKVHCAVERYEEIYEEVEVFEKDYEPDQPLNANATYAAITAARAKSSLKKENVTKPYGSANQSNSWGCAAILGGALTILFALRVIAMLVVSWQFLLPLAVIIFGFWLLAKAGNFISGLFSRMLPLLYFGFLGLICYSLFSVISDRLSFPEIPEEFSLEEADERTETKVATSTDPTDGRQLPPDTLILHHRVWRDYESNKYEGSLAVLLADFRRSRINREQLEITQDNATGWFRLYNQLEKHDHTSLNRVVTMLDSIRKANTLNEKQFADVVVSCIQDIPYVLVHPFSCEEINRHDGFSKNYHQSRMPCMPNVKFGVQAPAEYVANLKADCDTRTLLLYSVLSSFGYDVVILGSTVYSHAVLGINIPGTGAFKMVQGKRYYVWETTAKGMQLGQIAPEQNNMNNWDVMLMNASNNNLAVL